MIELKTNLVKTQLFQSPRSFCLRDIHPIEQSKVALIFGKEEKSSWGMVLSPDRETGLCEGCEAVLDRDLKPEAETHYCPSHDRKICEDRGCKCPQHYGRRCLIARQRFG